MMWWLVTPPSTAATPGTKQQKCQKKKQVSSNDSRCAIPSYMVIVIMLDKFMNCGSAVYID